MITKVSGKALAAGVDTIPKPLLKDQSPYHLRSLIATPVSGMALATGIVIGWM